MEAKKAEAQQIENNRLFMACLTNLINSQIDLLRSQTALIKGNARYFDFS